MAIGADTSILRIGLLVIALRSASCHPLCACRVIAHTPRANTLSAASVGRVVIPLPSLLYLHVELLDSEAMIVVLTRRPPSLIQVRTIDRTSLFLFIGISMFLEHARVAEPCLPGLDNDRPASGFGFALLLEIES